MQNKIISAFYFIDNSQRYTTVKTFCRNILENSQYKYIELLNFIDIDAVNELKFSDTEILKIINWKIILKRIMVQIKLNLLLNILD